MLHTGSEPAGVPQTAVAQIGPAGGSAVRGRAHGRLPKRRPCGARAGDGRADGSVEVRVEGGPPFAFRTGEDDDARGGGRYREVGDAGVVADEHPGEVQELRQRAEPRLARQIVHTGPGGVEHCGSRRALVARAGQDDVEAERGERMGDGGEPARRPAPVRVARPRVDNRQPVGPHALSGEQVEDAGAVGGVGGERKILTVVRRTEEPHEPEQPADLVASPRVLKPQAVPLRPLHGGQEVAGGIPSAEELDEGVGQHPVAVQLHGEVVMLSLDARQERRQCGRVEGGLGEPREPGEGEEGVHQAGVQGEHRHDLRQREERDAGVRKRRAQRTKGGDGAQHVAEARQRTDHEDAAGAQPRERADVGEGPRAVDVLVPTVDRPSALAVTLVSVAFQTHRPLRVVVSDQSERPGTLSACAELQAVLRLLPVLGIRVEVVRHMPRHGMAEQRQFLLGRATAPAVLFLDDDVIIEPTLVERLERALRTHGIGFVGSAVIGLSYLDDVRPHEQEVEFWDGPVEPEVVRPGSATWGRARLHNAANLYHAARRHAPTPRDERLYRVAWVGGCVLYDRAALEAAGGFGFWKDLPVAHAGEDALAQLRVMARSGGAGLLPSGAYHQELPTTVEDRSVDAPWAL